MRTEPPRINESERKTRIAALRHAMERANLAAVLLGATSSLRYFTGLIWSPSERFTGAIIHADGRLEFICPGFERTKVEGSVGVPGEVLTWEEDESPYALIADRLMKGQIGVDDQIALFMWHGLCRAIPHERLVDAGPVIQNLRCRKSPREIALMTHAKAITLEVQRRAWKELRAGIRASEVIQFIDQQHRRLGADGGNSFCIVAFGTDSSLPHGPEKDRALKEGEVVLIDTGCRIDGYNSDITRTYVFGEASRRVREVWASEKEAQAAAFEAAQLGAPCESVDAAARASLQRHGFGPNYRLPGLPHRTGHGIGLDVHESPNLVRGDRTPLETGMCFSNEPMIVVPNEFGVRLEDHFHMTERGPRWFTEPSHSIDEPFKGVAAFE
jgi:Xaa-Pro dipeptidase